MQRQREGSCQMCVGYDCLILDTDLEKYARLKWAYKVFVLF